MLASYGIQARCVRPLIRSLHTGCGGTSGLGLGARPLRAVGPIAGKPRLAIYAGTPGTGAPGSKWGLVRWASKGTRRPKKRTGGRNLGIAVFGAIVRRPAAGCGAHVSVVSPFVSLFPLCPLSRLPEPLELVYGRLVRTPLPGCFAVLTSGLGLCAQQRRYHWKVELIEAVEARLNAPVVTVTSECVDVTRFQVCVVTISHVWAGWTHRSCTCDASN